MRCREFSTVDAKILSFAEDVAEMAQIDVDNLMEVLLEYANAMSAFQHSPTDEAARRKATENFAEVTSLAFHRDVLPAQSRKLLDLFFWATASGQLIATSKHFQV